MSEASSSGLGDCCRGSEQHRTSVGDVALRLEPLNELRLDVGRCFLSV